MPNIQFRASGRTLTSHASLSIIGQCFDLAGIDSLDARFPTSQRWRPATSSRPIWGCCVRETIATSQQPISQLHTRSEQVIIKRHEAEDQGVARSVPRGAKYCPNGKMAEPGPDLNGWLAYYGAFYRSALYVIFRHFNQALVRWARRKFKPLRRYKIQASKFMERISEQCPTYLPTGGRVCVDRLLDGSGMNREVHVPFCERLRGRFPRSTHLSLKEMNILAQQGSGLLGGLNLKRKDKNCIPIGVRHVQAAP